VQERDCDQISVILIVIKHCTNGLALVFGRGAAVKGGLVVAGLLILPWLLRRFFFFCFGFWLVVVDRGC